MNDAICFMIYYVLIFILCFLISIGFAILFFVREIKDSLNKLVSLNTPEVTRKITKEDCEKLGGSVKDGSCVVIVKAIGGERVINIGEIVEEVKT